MPNLINCTHDWPGDRRGRICRRLAAKSSPKRWPAMRGENTMRSSTVARARRCQLANLVTRLPTAVYFPSCELIASALFEVDESKRAWRFRPDRSCAASSWVYASRRACWRRASPTFSALLSSIASPASRPWDLDAKVDPRDLRRGGAEHFRRHGIRPLQGAPDVSRTENRVTRRRGVGVLSASTAALSSLSPAAGRAYPRSLAWPRS